MYLQGMESIAKILGENLARERSSRGLSQAELGQKVGVQGLTVYRWETQKTWPSAQNVEDLAKVFKMESWELYAPQEPGKRTAKPTEPDPRVRDAIYTICRALGVNVAPRRPG